MMDLSVLFASNFIYEEAFCIIWRPSLTSVHLFNLGLVNMNPLLPILGFMSVVQIALLGLTHCIAALFEVDRDLHCQCCQV